MTYIPVFKPYVHQIAALDKGRNQQAFAYFMAMRTGKTKVTIDDWGEKVDSGELDSLLVLAPAGVYRTWIDELRKHLPSKIFDERLLIHLWESSKSRDWVRRLRDSWSWRVPAGVRVLLMNIEALSTSECAEEVCVRFLETGSAMLVIDESTTIKNRNSERTEAAMRLKDLAVYRRILSGLPAPRSPLDLYSQFEFLDHEILNFISYKAFEQRYADTRPLRVSGGHYIHIAKGYKNLEELSNKIEPYSHRVRLEDCSDIPSKLYVTREVALTKEQRRLYDDLKNNATAEWQDEYVTATQAIVLLLRLHQLCCGHLIDENGDAHDVPSNRSKALLDLLNEYDGKAVIWCSYHHDVRRIMLWLAKDFGYQSVASFWGGNVKEREAESVRFKTDPECKFMVATPGSGGRGRTWSEANLLVYYSNTDNLEHRDQSEERASGIGKTDRITIVDLITRDTVEEKIVQALRKKIDLAAALTKDPWRNWVV